MLRRLIKDPTELARRAVQRLLVRPSGWEFYTSGGIELQLSLPFKGLSVGGLGGFLYVREIASKRTYQLTFGGAGGGGGVGISLPTMVNASVSFKEFPSTSVGQIHLSPTQFQPLKPADFLGLCVLYSLNVSAAPLALTSHGVGGGGATVIFFGVPPAAVLDDHALAALKCKGAGILLGTSLTNALGVGASFFKGAIIRVAPSAP